MRKSISLFLALLGLFDSLYLLWIYTAPNRPMICMGTGCDAVRLSAYSHFHGVPMPVFGVAGYLVVALLIVAEALAPAALAIEARYALAGVTAFGFLYSLYLEYLQGFVIHAFCAWCVTSGLVMTAICALAIYDVVHAEPEADPPAQLAQLRQYFVVGVAALVIGVPAFYELATHGEPPPAPPPPVIETTAEKLVRADSHVAGDPHAAVTVVEFGDFECPICGNEEPVAEKIRAKYGNRIRFVFRQFPLVHIHKFSQRMAEASECAGEQGKFWEAVHEIYSRQDDLTEDGLKHDAAAIGLDPAKFNQCMASGAETARVNRDHADGVALGVNGTPTFFVGRNALPDVPTLDDLSQAIDLELASEGVEAPSAAAPPVAPAPRAPSAPPETTKIASKAETTSAKTAHASATAEPAPSGFGLLGSGGGGALQSFSDLTTCNESELTKKQPAVIHTDRLRELLAGNPKPLFVDVRPAKEFATGQIPGAMNIPLSDLPKSWSTLPKDRTIVFYESGKSAGDICASGRKAGSFMLEHGYAFDHVKVYQEGLAGWQKAGL